jgi:hypothetical protein
LFNGCQNGKLVNGEQLPDLRRHQSLPVQGLTQLRRDLAWAPTLVRRPAA